MRKSLTSSVLAGLSLVAVCAVAWVDVGRSSPGPLSPTHARFPRLLGRDGCSKCHGGIFQSMREGCVGCHEGIDRDLQQARGLHGNLPAGVAAEHCADCHREHGGAALALSGPASFARAGVPDREAYDHAALDFRLAGRHLELACAECHEQADAELLAEGVPRFRGLDQSCAACHDDVHRGAMARACADCHGQEHPFQEVQAFHHTQGFDGRGAHALSDCARCHEAEGAHAVEVLAGSGPFPPDRACADCHESPHDAGFLERSGLAADVPSETSCAVCHDALHEDWSAPAMGGEEHAATGFPLVPPHAELDCARCHEPAPDLPFAERFPGRGPDACAACHDDPHGGQFDHEPFLTRGCLACHERERFHPSAFGVAAHAGTAFALEGSHAAVACSACHAERLADGAARRFRGTGAACADCHRDAHRERLVAAPGSTAGCAECHDATLFAAVDHERFDHDARTSFVLDGAHERVSCEACHPRSARPDALQRRFGFVHEAFGEPTGACATCHADPHRGAFDAAPAAGAARERVASGCERCHTTESFATVEPTFDHERWTGYPLAREHAALDCESCHAPLATPTADGRRFGFAPGSACADCHADPHVGQFAADAKRCEACHERDLTLSFDHQRDSRFPLDATHARLDCAACHRPWPLVDGRQAVRYKPLGLTCTECHGPGGGAR